MFYYVREKASTGEFVDNLYRSILQREPDSTGRKSWIDNLESGKCTRLQALCAMYNSSEFKLNNRINFNLILFKTFLFFWALAGFPLFLFKKFLSKYFKRYEKDKQIEFGFNVAGYINLENGVGESTRGILRALEKGSIKFNLNYIPVDKRRENNLYKSDLTQQNFFPINLVYVNADQVPFVSRFLPEGRKYFENKYNIGYWAWETPVFPQKYVPSLNFFQEIWAPSDFVVNSIAVKSSIPVIKISPSFVPSKTLKRENGIFQKLRIGVLDKDFVFLVVFDASSYWQRKNPETTVSAFQTAFKNQKNIKLVIKVVGQQEDKLFFHRFAEKVRASNNIFLINKYFEPEIMEKLYSRADAYVSLHRCEGQGITMIKSMLLGKPTIATCYGGNTDFMNINNSYLVKYDKYCLGHDIGPYEKGSVWAEPDPTHAAYFMKEIYNDYPRAIQKGKRARADVKEYFKPERIAGLIKNRIEVIKKSI